MENKIDGDVIQLVNVADGGKAVVVSVTEPTITLCPCCREKIISPDKPMCSSCARKKALEELGSLCCFVVLLSIVCYALLVGTGELGIWFPIVTIPFAFRVLFGIPFFQPPIRSN